MSISQDHVVCIISGNIGEASYSLTDFLSSRSKMLVEKLGVMNHGHCSELNQTRRGTPTD